MNTNLEFNASMRQSTELRFLMNWSQELSYALERFNDDLDYINRCRSNIEYGFNCLDALQVPFWVQNAAYFYGNDWRHFCSSYTDVEMSKKGINLK